jgi:hypothetical protein
MTVTRARSPSGDVSIEGSLTSTLRFHARTELPAFAPGVSAHASGLRKPPRRYDKYAVSRFIVPSR